MDRRTALAGPATFGVGLLGLRELGRLGRAGSLRFSAELGTGPLDGLILGNSVARAAIDPAGLPGRWVSLALQGSQPAHWVALLRHQVFAGGWRPRRVLIVGPPHVLCFGPLVEERDRALLVDLLTGPDEELLAAAAPGLDDPLDRLDRGRRRARRGLVAALGHTLPEALFADDVVAEAFAAAPLPSDPDAAFATVPGAPTPGRAPHVDPPMVAVEAGFLPMLQADCAAAGSELLLVSGPRRRPGCATGPREAPVVAWAADHGVGLLDLGGEELDPGLFSTELHPTEAGRAVVTARLAAALGGVGLRCR